MSRAGPVAVGEMRRETRPLLCWGLRDSPGHGAVGSDTWKVPGQSDGLVPPRVDGSSELGADWDQQGLEKARRFSMGS